MKKLLTFFLTALLAFSVGWAETDVLTRAFTGVPAVSSYNNWSGKEGLSGAVYAGNSAGGNDAIQLRSTNNSGIVTTGSGGSVKKITVVWNSNTTNGRTLNVYGKNSAYSAASDLYNTSNQGNLLGTIVMGTSTSLTISGNYEYIGFRSNSGAMYLTSVSIEWETGGSSTVDPPTITPNGGNFATSQEVTLSHDDADAAIYYTTNGVEPTTSSTLYTSPFTIYETTTVKAIAVKDGVSSSPASATFNEVGVATIAEAYALNQGSQFIFTGNAVVTYQNDRYVWIRDNSGSGLIYRKSGDTSDMSNGDILNAGWTATNTTYNSIPEFSNPTDVASNSNGGAVAPFDKTSTGVTSANVNEYVSFSNITPNWDTDLGYCYVTYGNNKVYFRNTFFSYINNGLTVTSGHTYNIEGIVYHQNNNVFVYMTSVTEIQSSNPLLEVSPSELTINDTDNTLTITGENITGNINASLANNTDWYLTSNQFSNTGGTTNVVYNGRDLSASNTVSVSANGVQNIDVPVNYLADLYIVTDNGVTNDWHFDGAYGEHMTNNNGVYTATFTAENPNTFILFARKLGNGVDWNTRFVFGPDSGGDWWLPIDGNGSGNIDLYDDDPIKIQTAGTYIITIDATGSPVTFTITKEVVNEGDFVLVTNTADLAAGNEVIIVNSGTAGSARTMGQRNENNYYGTGVTVSATQKVTPTNDTQIFTLEQGAGGWYFKTSDDLYLNNMNSGNNNYLQTKGKDANGTGTSLAAINIGSDNAASIVFQGSGSRKTLQYNPNGITSNPSANDIFSCYSGTQQDVFIYQREASAPEPSITVNPSSLDLVIPVGESSVSGNVTVTETNTTGTTSVSINGDTDIFSATLENGTLTVTYNGNATMTSPDVATITLTNGDATATVNVTGYKRVEATGTLYSKVTNANQIQDGLQYILVYEDTPEALNGITTGGTGAEVSWEEQGSIINISGTDVIEFTLNGNANGFTLSSDHGYLNPSAPGLAFDEEDGTAWSAESNNGGYVLKWGNYMMRYNSGASAANGRFRIYDGTTGTPVYLYVQGSAVATPVITPASGNYAEDQEVTITCATTGATIYYTVNGGETQTYNGPFTVDVDEDHTTTTIAAWAEDGEQHHSPTVTVTYTYKKDHVSSIAEFLELDEGEEVTFQNPVVVLFDYSQNSSNGQEYIWVKDRTGYTQFFIAPVLNNDTTTVNDGDGFWPKYENGDIIPAGFKVKKNYYSNGEYYQGQCYEWQSTFRDTTGKALADPEQVLLSELIAHPDDYNNRYLFINKLKVTGFINQYGTTGKWNFYVAADEDGTIVVDPDTTIVGYNKYNSPAWKDKEGNVIGVTVPTDGEYYNVKFIFQKWTGGYELMPIEFTPWEDNSLRLEDLVKEGELNHDYTISNQLHAVAVTWDSEKDMFAIFAKDDGMYANKRYPATGQDTYLIRYENQNGTFINEVEQEDYDQSNWIEILIPSTITQVTSKTTDVNAYIQELGNLQSTFENKILDAGSVFGTYVDALNPTIEVTALPTVASLSTYEPNIYCTANFLMENLDTDGAQGNDGNYFMMDAKPHEFCKVVWAYYDNSNGNYFVIPAREGNVVNGHGFTGSFMANMSLCEDYQVYYDFNQIRTWFLDSNDESYNGQQTLYGFDAIIRKNPNANNSNGAPRRIQPGTGDFEQTPAYIVYPLNAGGNSNDNVVSVKEVLGNKAIESVHYYNMMGMEGKTPFEGINIVVTRYTDGSTSTIKVMK